MGGRQTALGRSHFNSFSFRDTPGCQVSPFPHGTCALSVSSSIFRVGGWDPLFHTPLPGRGATVSISPATRRSFPGNFPPKPSSAQNFPPRGPLPSVAEGARRSGAWFTFRVHSRTLGVILVGACGERGNARKVLFRAALGPNGGKAPPAPSHPPAPGPTLVRFRSPLPAESRLISLPRPTEMFYFGRCWSNYSLEFLPWGTVEKQSPPPTFVVFTPLGRRNPGIPDSARSPLV